MLSSAPLAFTPRQVQIIRLIDQGLTYDEMGEQLGIAPRTVKAHADTIRIKLNVKRKRHIPRALRERGIQI
jgi:DNA-binding CsgD family transcriptional regulator